MAVLVKSPVPVEAEANVIDGIVEEHDEAIARLRAVFKVEPYKLLTIAKLYALVDKLDGLPSNDPLILDVFGEPKVGYDLVILINRRGKKQYLTAQLLSQTPPPTFVQRMFGQ